MEKFEEKLREYLEVYDQYFVEDIFDLGYKATLFRDLIIYFSYKDKKHNKKISLSYLAKVFKKADHTAILKAIKRTKQLIEQPEHIRYMYGVEISNIYLHLFYTFNKIQIKK